MMIRMSNQDTEQKLAEHRSEINRLDQEIVRLMNERTRHALAIGEIKVVGGQEIYAPHRERDVFERVKSLNAGPIRNDSLCAVYREIMSAALSLQKSLRVAYLGPETTFTHQAALSRFGASLTYLPQKTVADVFTEVSKGRADYGVAPVENSTEGIVNNTLDMLVDTDLKVVAQIVMSIRQCLVANCKKNQVQHLYAHPQSLEQCRFWLLRTFDKVEIVETASSKLAAEKAAADPVGAALTSSLGAQMLGLDILEANVQDSQSNYTRFLVMGKQCSPRTGRDHTSLMISVPDKVGALLEALEPFTRHKISMSRIESRPNKRKALEYYFFLDLYGHTVDTEVSLAIRELEQKGAYVKVLGSYPEPEWR